MTTQTTKKPTHRLYYKDGEYHREIGAGWSHSKGEGLYVEIHSIPTRALASGSLQLTAFRVDADQDTKYVS